MNVFETFKTAIFHPSELAKTKKMSFGKTILYLLLLTLLATIPIVMNASHSVSKATEEINTYLKHTPNFSIRNHTLQTNKKEGFIYDAKGMKLAFDPENKETPDELINQLDNDVFGISLRKNEMVYAMANDNPAHTILPTNPLIIPYKQLGMNTITKTDIKNIINNPSLKAFFLITMFFIAIFPSLMNLLFNILLTSVVAFIYCKMLNLSLKFGQVFKISMSCMTLPIIIAIIAGILFNSLTMINFIYSMSLLVFFIAINKEQNANT